MCKGKVGEERGHQEAQRDECTDTHQLSHGPWDGCLDSGPTLLVKRITYLTAG